MGDAAWRETCHLAFPAAACGRVRQRSGPPLNAEEIPNTLACSGECQAVGKVPRLPTSPDCYHRRVFHDKAVSDLLCTHDDCSGRAPAARGMVWTSSMNWLTKRGTVSFFWARPACCCFPTPTCPGRLADGHHLRDLVVHPRDRQQLPEGCQFSHRSGEHPGPMRMGHSLVLLWAPEARRFVAGCSWVASGHSLRCTALSSLIGFMLRQFEILAWLGIPPLQRRLPSSGPIAVVLCRRLRSTHWSRQLVLRAELRLWRDLPFPAVPAAGGPTTGTVNPFPHGWAWGQGFWAVRCCAHPRRHGGGNTAV